MKISKTPAPEEHVSKQEVDEESLCSATVVEPVQFAISSTAAPDYRRSRYHVLSSRTLRDALSLSVSAFTRTLLN